MRDAWCAEKQGDGKIRCGLCIIRCVIGQGKRGICKTRENQGGSLINCIYASLSSFSTDFIEKVPLYHFYPNQRFLTLGSVGCNLRCAFCLTWSITQNPVDEIAVETVSPERLVTAALELGCKGIAYTHSEPTLNIEFYSRVMEKAKNVGLKNVLATNGFMSIEAFMKIADLLDAVALTFKGDRKFYLERCKVKPDKRHFKEVIDLLKSKGIHLEMVYVLIPGENDNEESLNDVIELTLHARAPLIFLRFFPSYEMEEVESPSEEDLERAVNMAYSKGVEFAYVENIFEHPGKNTYCPDCRTSLVERAGYGIVKWSLLEGCCPNCGRSIPITGEPLIASSKAR